MILLFQFILIFGNGLMAWYHARLIKAEKTINHPLWGGLYLVVAAGLSWWIHSWILLALSLLIRKVFFDLLLNLFRGLPLFYVSLKPASLIDRFHNWVFGKKSEIYMAIYFVAIIVINLFV